MRIFHKKEKKPDVKIMAISRAGLEELGVFNVIRSKADVGIFLEKMSYKKMYLHLESENNQSRLVITDQEYSSKEERTMVSNYLWITRKGFNREGLP